MARKRNIIEYEKTYLDHKFEKEMVTYRMKNISEALEKYKPKKILEIGCGMDSMFNHYTIFEEFTVVEPSEVFLEKARQDAGTNVKIKLIKGFFEDKVSELENLDVDFIIFSNLLHEVPEPLDFLSKIKEIISKNCIVYINVTNSESFHKLWAFESGLIESINEPSESFKQLQQTTIFNLVSLENLIQKAGFLVVEKGSYFFKPFNHAKMYDLMQDGTITQELMDGLYKMTKYFPEHGAEIFMTCKLK